MAFLTDKQTLDDLNIFGRHGQNSIYHIFNSCATRGGAAVLEAMFRDPLSDTEAINRRSDIIRYFSSANLSYPFENAVFDAVQIYMDNTDSRTRLTDDDDTVTKKLSNILAMDAMTTQIKNGITGITELLKGTHCFINELSSEADHNYQKELTEIKDLLSQPVFTDLVESRHKLSYASLIKFDNLLRFRNREEVKRLMDYLYHLDVYISVGRIARERTFAFPKALPEEERITSIDGLYHPLIEQAVPNDIRITRDGNVIFLTGANMAGKSTFMKSFSVAIYLAHMGFPVACANMEFAVLDGIYTTINLPDDLGMGASHFYAEVVRVKKISRELKTRKLFIVFDELFRGTNVKDAAEATIAVTHAFSRYIDSVFLISTHIVEAGDVLRQRCPNINFVFMPTLMDGTKPVYTYKLEQGITEDRHGMIIINNERILEILGKGGAIGRHTSETKEKGSFIADRQTLEDLNLLGKFKPNSIYSLFNRVQTTGGERLLEQMFHQPLVNAEEINARSNLFRYFGEMNMPFPFNKEVFTKAEHYLNTSIAHNCPVAVAELLIKKIQHSFLRDTQFSSVQEGLGATIKLLNACREFVSRLAQQDQNNNPYTGELRLLRKIFADARLQWITAERDVQKLPFIKVAKYDYLLKQTLRNQMEMLLESLYRLDVYISVSRVANERGLAYAEAVHKDSNLLRTTALWHPSLVNGTANQLSLNREKNMVFLTGANMAGKSTFMKAFGIAVYLAHMGFPVAAREMQFSVRDGLYSSINVHDDLNMGYSHFYAEVMRVKKVAAEVSEGKNLIVLFDELFKGTNVKDAYDGTLSVTAAFARYRKCLFVVSTHIIEVGAALQESANIQFAYLPTVMEGKIPRYSYQLKEGITADRQGMMIIENEGILDILNEPSNI